MYISTFLVNKNDYIMLSLISMNLLKILKIRLDTYFILNSAAFLNNIRRTIII